jgi:phospholipid-binding lipoprotein MlaA
LKSIALALTLAAAAGCASTGERDPRDPLEPLNRGIYSFNDHVDHLLVKPAAEIYKGLVPEIVRTGVSNFFSNLNDVIVALNSLLQGKVTQAALDVSRIVVNTTAGLLGTIDVATEIGLEKHNEDFGQTLGYWGLGAGPYIVIPLLGPSSLRDSVGLLADWKTDPKTYIEPPRDRNALWGLYFVSRRSELLETSKILDVAALDPYEFVRDAYLQRRRNLVYDGAAPDEDDTEIKEKPKPSGTSLDGDKEIKSILVSGDRVPTPAELEDRERQERSTTVQPRAETDPAARSRVVRVWIPSSRN